jgi:hypothetical protein
MFVLGSIRTSGDRSGGIAIFAIRVAGHHR